MTRDDRDRLLIVGGLAWLWATTLFPLGAFGPPPQAPGVRVAPAIAILALLTLLAALALWRQQAWARVPLVAGALALPVVAVVADNPVAAVGAVGGAVAVAVGTARLRIPPEPIDGRRAEPRPRPSGPVRATGDLRDDRELAAFLEAAAHLDRERTRVLSAAWRAADPAARRAAWHEVRREAELAGRTDALDALRREIELWGRAAGGSPWTWEWATMTDIDRSDVRRGAMPALLDAAAALLLRDRLATASIDALTGPWEATMAEPAEQDPRDHP